MEEKVEYINFNLTPKMVKILIDFNNTKKEVVNVNIELDKNVNLGIGQFVPVLFH